MKTLALSLVAAAALLTGCGKKETPSPFNTELSTKEVMGHVIDYGARDYWKHSGSYVDATGEHSYAPTDDDGWIAQESAALTVAEATNSLLLPGRVRKDDSEDWIRFVKLLREKAVVAAQAAEKRDEDAMFRAGADLYQVCTDCHSKFLLPFLDEKTGEPKPGSPLDQGEKAPPTTPGLEPEKK